MTNTFEATEAAKTRMPTLAKTIEEFAFAQANEFIDAGQPVREATSIVANMMVRAAWAVAACGVLSEGGVPDKDKFRSTVEAQMNAVCFKSTDSKAEGGAA
ncbi:hypothetical protein GHK45_23700 [Sinorhizobium meliloti]|uniref:Uncharacterized protein n=1 Tax=Rhizobium meliloti TaxID=382 RepID=A0A6A7ZV92_RHIML|nr:hypothetical protein [Sinorhizobium meliloti]MQW06620.1 hypothetical protein [Sinorhizobium meliloti]